MLPDLYRQPVEGINKNLPFTDWRQLVQDLRQISVSGPVPVNTPEKGSGQFEVQHGRFINDNCRDPVLNPATIRLERHIIIQPAPRCEERMDGKCRFIGTFADPVCCFTGRCKSLE